MCIRDRQTSIHKEDKQRIKQLLRQFLPDLFHHPRQELSEDERDDAGVYAFHIIEKYVMFIV